MDLGGGGGGRTCWGRGERGVGGSDHGDSERAPPPRPRGSSRPARRPSRRTWGRPAVLPLPVHLHQADTRLPDPGLQRRLVLRVHPLTPQLAGKGQVGMADGRARPHLARCARGPVPRAGGARPRPSLANTHLVLPLGLHGSGAGVAELPFITSSLPASGSFPAPPPPLPALAPSATPPPRGVGGSAARGPRPSGESWEPWWASSQADSAPKGWPRTHGRKDTGGTLHPGAGACCKSFSPFPTAKAVRL